MAHVFRNGSHSSLGRVDEALREVVGAKAAPPALRLMVMYCLAETALALADLDAARGRVAAGLELARVTGIHVWTQ
jgi:hypothetical protein